MPYKSKDAQLASNRRSYRKNAEKVKADIRARKVDLISWWKQYKATLVCFHCGEDEADCIDLHHVISTHKTGRSDSPANWVWVNSRSKERILRDIAEFCVPLCANCHRKVHSMHRRILREQGLPAPHDILDDNEAL